MFRRPGAGSGALWRPWYDGGRHGDRELAQLRCVAVFCVSIVRKLIPHSKIAREQKIPPLVGATNARVGELIGTILYLGFFFLHLPCSY